MHVAPLVVAHAACAFADSRCKFVLIESVEWFTTTVAVEWYDLTDLKLIKAPGFGFTKYEPCYHL